MQKNRRFFLKNFFSSLFLLNIFLVIPYNKIQFQIKKFKKKKDKNLIWYLDESDYRGLSAVPQGTPIKRRIKIPSKFFLLGHATDKKAFPLR